MKKIPDHFTVDGYEVRFLQSAPVTVCVIRSLKDLEKRYTGIADWLGLCLIIIWRGINELGYIFSY